MFEEETTELFKKYRDGKATARERAIVDQWYLENHAVNPDADLVDLEIAQQKSLKALMNQIRPSKSLRLGYRMAAAASVILVLGAGIYLIKSISRPGILYSFQGQNAKNDIAPGINGATLTLANGSKIKLSDAVNGRLASEGGVSITKEKDGQLVYVVAPSLPGKKGANMNHGATQLLNTLSTSNGEQYQVILPDQTKVWLNASSTIKYPSSFSGTMSRHVILIGEAYFEVSKTIYASMPEVLTGGDIAKRSNERVPFIVSTKNQTIEVLGTHFNINSYEDEMNTKTTLLEGSVRVSSLQAGNNVVLKPGEQSITTKENIRVVPADPEQETAWKNGQFYFKNTTLQTVMRQIARWYNVEVVYDKALPDQVILGGWISRSRKISAILNLIELTGQAHFKIDGRRITVMP